MKRIAALVASCALLGAPMISHASAAFSGTFSGTTEKGSGVPDGTVVTGSFALDTARLSDPDFSYPTGTESYLTTPNGQAPLFTLTLTVGGQTSTYASDGGFLLDTSTAGAEQTLAVRDTDTNTSASLYLAGNLLSGPDPRTAHAGAVDLGASSVFFFDSQSFQYATVQLTSVTFDGATAPVPEPASWALMTLGCAGLALRRRAALRS